MKPNRWVVGLSIICIMMFPFQTSANQVPGDDYAGEIEDIMENMTLEEKVGQLFIVHVYGTTPTDPDYEDINLNNNRGGKNFKEVIENYHIGGVLYFNWTDNIGTPLDAQQVNGLSNGLQEIAMEESSIPLFISIDQEGGIVQRATSPATVFPGNMALGATGSEQLASESGSILGKEMNALGVNMNFAPTVDVNVNPDNPVIGVRSYGEDPELVSKLGVAQITAMENENVITSAKHFPGHGDTDVDSHYGLPIIESDLETLYEVDLKPFRDAVDAGIGSIMTAHIVVPALDDSGLPATLSKPILTDLLRDEMGYEGLIITDSLGMAGADIYPPEQVPVEAFKAGADLLLNPPNVEVAYNGMLDAVESGEVSMERLDESVFRILQAKMDYGYFEDPFTDSEAINNIGTDAHLQTAQEIADKSITLVKNDNEALPVNNDESVLVTGPSAANPAEIAEQLEKLGIEANSFTTAASPTEAEIVEAGEQAADADKVIVTTYTANTNAAQQDLVQAMVDTDKPVIAAAMRNPYDLMEFPEVDAYLNAYSYLDVSTNAMANALAGEINPFGKLPVTIPDLFDINHGIDYVDKPLSAEGIKEMADDLLEEGEISNEEAHRTISMHLAAVQQYEEGEQQDKVIRHIESFQMLTDHYKDAGVISDKAFSYLDTRTIRYMELWTE
ncbi:glycoside hydrolase family 3 protein [Virgibacillus kimchii]